MLDQVNAHATQDGKQPQIPIVFEGNAPAEIRENAELKKLLRLQPSARPVAARAWLGAPNSIKGPTEAQFQRLAAVLTHRVRIGGPAELPALMADLSKELEALKPHQKDFTVFSGLDHGVKGGHFAISSFLSGVRAINAKGMPESNMTLDQRAAETLGGVTRYPSITLGSETGLHGGCLMSWTRSGTRVPPIGTPRELFRKLFVAEGSAGTAASLDHLDLKASILDSVHEDAKSLGKRLGQHDKEKLDEYLTSARKAWGQIARFHNEKRTGSSQGNGGGIVENKRTAISEGKFPFIRIYETKIRGPIADQWPPSTQQAVLGTIPFEPENMRKILQTFANRAFRRPATQEEVDRLMTVAERRLSSGLPPREGLKEAMKDALKAALCSPAFLYLSQDSMPVAPGSKARPRLDTYALASRLSYFLWSSMPDNELLRTAQSQELAKPEVLLAQTRRVLASPRSNAFIKSFLDSWLNLRNLGATPPDRNDFELYYAKNLEHAFKEETRLFMRDLIDSDYSILHFIDSDYSFVNQALANHYELGDLGNPARAHEFRKVPLRNSNRGGLLGMGCIG